MCRSEDRLESDFLKGLHPVKQGPDDDEASEHEHRIRCHPDQGEDPLQFDGVIPYLGDALGKRLHSSTSPFFFRCLRRVVFSLSISSRLNLTNLSDSLSSGMILNSRALTRLLVFSISSSSFFMVVSTSAARTSVSRSFSNAVAASSL